jgi:transcriptional activator SPT7
MGIAKEHGLSSLSIPSALFYGRRKRAAQAQAGKADVPDYPPPPPFVPLAPNYATYVPALLHVFFARRVEKGEGLADAPAFDAAHAQIGSLGQIVHKNPPPAVVPKKKVVVEVKKKPKKVT